MNQSDLLHYKNLLLTKQQELSASKSAVGSIPAASELGGDPGTRFVHPKTAATELFWTSHRLDAFSSLGISAKAKPRARLVCRSVGM